VVLACSGRIVLYKALFSLCLPAKKEMGETDLWKEKSQCIKVGISQHNCMYGQDGGMTAAQVG